MADAATLFPSGSGKVTFPEPGGSGLEWAAEADMAMLQDDPNFLEWLNGWLGGKADEDSVMENAFSTLNEFGAQIDFQQSLNQQQQQQQQQEPSPERDPNQRGTAPSSAPTSASVPSAAASIKREGHARNESCGSMSTHAHSSHPASDASGSLLAAASPCGDSDNSSGAASALRAWATGDPLSQAQSLPPPHAAAPLLGGLINGTGAAQAPFGGYSVSFTGLIGAQQQQPNTQAPLGLLDTSLLPHSITAPAALTAAAAAGSAPCLGTAADLNGVLRVPSHGTVSSFVGGPTCATAPANTTTTTTVAPLAPGLPTGGSAGHLGASLGTTAGLGLGLGVAASAGSVGNLLSGFNTTSALLQQQQQQGLAHAAAAEQPGGSGASVVNVPSLERLLEMALYGTKGSAGTGTTATAATAGSSNPGSCTAADRSAPPAFARDSAEFGSSGGEEPMAGVECGGWVPYGTTAGGKGGALPSTTPSTSGSAHLRRRSSSHLALGSSGSGHHNHHGSQHHPHGVHVSHVTGHGHVAKSCGGAGGRGSGVNAAGKLTRNARSKAVFAGLEAEVAGKLQQLEALQREHQTLTQKVEILQVAVDRQNVVLSLMHRTGAGAGTGDGADPGASAGKGSGSGSAAAAAAAAAVAAATAARAASGGLGVEGSAGRQGDSGSVGSGAVKEALSSCGSGGMGEEALLAGGGGLGALGLGMGGGMGAGGLGLGGAGLMTAFAYVPRGPEGRELLEWARGCSVEGYIAWYKEYVKELSLALLELDSSGSSPATLDRLTQLVAGAGIRNSLVCVFQPTVHLRLKGLNLETGAYAEPPDEHWINVIRFMTISAQEVAEMESLWESYNLLHCSFTAELQDTQRDLQELIGKAAGQGPAGAGGGAAGLSLRTCSEEVMITAMKQTALMKRVRSILQKTHLLYSCTIWVAVMRIMKPKEFARCVVHSYPYHPCGPSLMRACRTARELRLIWGISDPMCAGGGCGGQAAATVPAAPAPAAGPGAGLLSR